jgi:hypothetical protein
MKFPSSIATRSRTLVYRLLLFLAVDNTGSSLCHLVGAGCVVNHVASYCIV